MLPSNIMTCLSIVYSSIALNIRRYSEYERSTCLQMLGRAGRPQFDTEGVAVIMTHKEVRGSRGVRYTAWHV